MFFLYTLSDNLIVQGVAGSGKTTLGLEIIKRLNKNALILTPTLTIREQWIERFVQDFLIDKALKDKLGVEGMIKFIQMYSDGKGDYTKEKYENNEELTIEDFEKYLAENN